MGYGVFTIPSFSNITALKIDPHASINRLLDLFDNPCWVESQRKDPQESFYLSVLMWLTVTVNVMTDGETFRRLSSMMHLLSDILLSSNSSNLVVNSLHVMKAVSSIQMASNNCIDYSSVDNEDEKRVLVKLTQCFVNLKVENLKSNSCSSGKDVMWIESYTSLLHQNVKKSHVIFLPAANSCVNDLCDCLFSPAKRWCAFQLLHLLAASSKSLHTEGDAIISPETGQNLSAWKKLMAEEEAMELDDDVHVSASWLPERMMSLLQIIEMETNHTDDEVCKQDNVIGNLLAWIICLDILDAAGAVDMRNRSSISSFLQKTNAISCIMNMALSEADLDIDRHENIFSCVDLDGKNDFVLKKIATLAVFRTVESLPTLVKTWFNDDCARYLQPKLSLFVESRVAPETLQRELARIKEATSFGEMTVSGSCVSREVVAIYQQDEVRESTQKVNFLQHFLRNFFLL